jgi:hypothetical protein
MSSCVRTLCCRNGSNPRPENRSSAPVTFVATLLGLRATDKISLYAANAGMSVIKLTSRGAGSDESARKPLRIANSGRVA